jgi:OOP family OmpA-OmpF porin
MKLKLLMVIGAATASFVIGAPAAAAERHSDMVIAQAQQQSDKDKEKEKDQRFLRGGQGQKQGQPAGQQQQMQKPVQQQQMQKPVQNQQLQKPVQQQQMQKPVQNQQLQKPVQQQQLQKPVQNQQLQKPVQQQQLQKPVQNQQLQKPVQQQQLQKPALGQVPAFDKNKGQAPTIQTQQRPVMAPGNQRLDQVRGERRETREGNRTVIREQNRTITREGGRTFIRHDDTDRFRRGARDVRVEHRGNETETIIVRPDGVRIITIVDVDGRLLRRVRRERDGREFVLIDNRHMGPPGAFGFIANLAAPDVRMPRDRYIVDADGADNDLLYETLIAPPVMHIERRYTLDEIRYTHNLREWMPRIDLDTITFETGSWEVTPDQARRLEPIAAAMRRAIRRDPNEVYLIEGHTDAVGSDIDNLSLSDRRAETVAEILTQDFGIPPENLTTQGYGEQYLKVPTPGPERRNRRVTVRRITPLLTGQN